MNSRMIGNSGPATRHLLALLVVTSLAFTADQLASAQESTAQETAETDVRIVPPQQYEQHEQEQEGRQRWEIREQSSEPVSQQTEYLRMRRDEDGNDVALQTSITRFRPDDGDVIIDLVGAVHIGDGDYYRKLNRQFELYDVVLYELVAQQGTRVPAGGAGPSDNPIGMLQQSAQRMLGLESQLALIDYQAENFVHADLSPAEMQQKMAERGDSMLTVGLDAISEMIRNQNRAMQEAQNDSDNVVDDSAGGMFDLMGDPQQMKRMMAMQFTEGGGMDLGLGQSLNQILIDDRNEAAMRVLQQQLVNGQKRIAIFYGAAHMADFEQRLVNNFGLQMTEQVWVDAWDLNREIETDMSDPMNMMMQLLNSLDE
ncbi:MAG: hypothetical protein AAF456_07540 [Planctomycetota bacterium]